MCVNVGFDASKPPTPPPWGPYLSSHELGDCASHSPIGITQVTLMFSLLLVFLHVGTHSNIFTSACQDPTK